MTAISVPAMAPYGMPNRYAIWITASSVEYNLSNKMIKFRILKKKNSIWTGTFTFRGLTQTEKDNIVKIGNTFKFFSNNTIIYKGTFENLQYESSSETEAFSKGAVATILTNRVTARVQYDSTANTTIFTNFLSGTGVTAGTNESLGNLTARAEFTPIWNAIVNLAEQTDFDLWESWGSHPYNSLLLNQAFNMGSQTSVKTFTRIGAGANLIEIKNKPDRINQVNHIKILGYGDGINQIKSENYHATTVRSALNGEINSTTTTVVLDDTTGLSASDKIKVGEEVMTITNVNIDGVTLTVTRGATDEDSTATTAYTHSDNVAVYKYYDDGNAEYLTPASGNTEANSSIADYGLKQMVLQRREIIDQNTLDLLTQRIITRFKDPVDRITIKPANPKDVLDTVSLGDFVTINDTLSGLAGNYEVVSMDISFDQSGETLNLDITNSDIDVFQQVAMIKDKIEKEASYMQGSTNIYAISNSENCDTSKYLDLKFYLPSEVIQINSIKLNFKIKNYRAYTSTSSDEAAHTHSLTGVTSGSNASGSKHWSSGTNVSGGANPDYITLGIPTVSSGTWNRTQFLGTYWNKDVGNQTVTLKFYEDSNELFSDGSQVIGANNFRTITYNETVTNYGDGSIGKFEVGGTDGAASGDYLTFTIIAWDSHTHSFTGETTAAGTSHTHPMTYAIDESAAGSDGTIDLYVGADGGESLVAAGLTDKTNYDITSQVQAVGAGNWVNIQFRPNKKMRVEANAYVQIFIESKVV